MLARLAFGGVSAVCCAIWLFRLMTSKAAVTPSPIAENQSKNSGDSPSETVHVGSWAVSGIRVVALFWCGIWALIWLAIALVRLRYPYELEWAGGAMRDHCEQVLAGRSLYPAPGAGWVPARPLQPPSAAPILPLPACSSCEIRYPKSPFWICTTAIPTRGCAICRKS